jgi:regulator of protease activity HflC (stomatin/prohibitin superfamily)
MDLKSQTVDIPLEVYSKDSQLAPTNILSVTFSLPRQKVEEVYQKYGANYFEAVLKKPVENIFREEFGKKTADEIIGDRITLNESISARLKVEFETRGPLFERLSISIRFNDSFNTAAEKSAIARTEVNTATQNLDKAKKDAESAEARATGEANADFIKKQKEAEGILAIGEAEVKVMEQKSKVIQENISLVHLITAEKWDGQLPTTMIPGQSTPLIHLDVKPNASQH